ncbi:aminotransferase class I/II-fold pyridoxal phosphate-dependent enzyme [Actinocatenispora rupis]|uniref:GntR family transcriptional regulator n=1 Tax=Actinocatenispora rupis TaxID=519421 RepID=A0A8J3J332_9ACTN|nr:PLP-dependent aminotransferase family protein [Actinocatenispora rupis]GID10696.1 GntR family transcriptional regulator [Actinocatenispora rupis]
MRQLLTDLEQRLDEPTARALATAVSAALRDGVLGEGDRLPPIRTVATELKLSPTTVSSAWALLARAGTIRTDGRRGTTIAPRHAPGPTRYRRALERSTSFALDLSTGVPDPDLLPGLGPALQRLHVTASPGSYLDDPVLPDLLDALRDDWPYRAERMTVVDGAMDALDEIATSVLRFGDRVAVEHPCFPPLLDLLDAVGVRPVGVAVDDDGPVVTELAAAGDVAAFFLQPRAQNPTGATLTAERARQLAAVLDGSAAVVVEDDSAGGIAAHPAVSLGSRLPDRTIHVRSYSKSHGPDLRLAAVGGPARLIDPIVERRFLGQGWTSRLLQHLLLDLLTRRASITEVARARREYARRREAVVRRLADRGVEVGGSEGLNIWVPVRDEAAAVIRLASVGIGAAAGGPFHVREGAAPHLRLTTGLLRTGFADVADRVAEAAAVGAWASPR